jgi:hypothetical protein
MSNAYQTYGEPKMNTVIKEKEYFRLTMKKESCLMPVGLNNIEFTGEQLKDGEIINSSTYQFFMTEEELAILAKALTA